jgi:hypothetical protein
MQILHEKGVEMKYTFWGIAVTQVVVTLTNTVLHWKESPVIPDGNQTIQTEGANDDTSGVKDNAKTNEKGSAKSYIWTLCL